MTTIWGTVTRAPCSFMEVFMDVFTKVLSIMDSAIIAMLDVPILAIFLVGSLVLAGVGIFIMLSNAARGRRP